MASVVERSEALEACRREALACERCPQLVRSRSRVVFGTGDVSASVLVVGEAPGREEDVSGTPLAGRAGRLLLGELLGSAGLGDDEVFVTNAVLCRPPDNRDPASTELERCRDWLDRVVELVRPQVICTLGTLPTRLLRGRAEPITRIHGQVEPVVVGSVTAWLLPLFHPAAALYQPASVEVLRADVALIPGLLAADPPVAVASNAESLDDPGDATVAAEVETQLGLF